MADMEKREIVLTFMTAHAAMAGEQVLLDCGVAVRVMPRPSALGDGCGICLRVDEVSGEAARARLEAAGVEVEAAYLKHRENGKSAYRQL